MTGAAFRSPAGPLSGVVVEVVGWLCAAGYARGTVTSVACTTARLGVWMQTTGLGVGNLDDELLERFAAAQTDGPRPHPSSGRRIVTVRQFLAAAGLMGTTSKCDLEQTVLTATQECVRDWVGWLRRERQIGPGRIRELVGWTEPFLD